MNTRACIDYLLPNAKCTIFNEVVTEWLDARTQPTQAEIEAAWPTVEALLQAASSNPHTIRDNLDAAVTNLRAYRDLASPTNAQTIAVVKLLCRVAIGLIRLTLNKFDSTE